MAARHHDGPHHPDGPVECFGCKVKSVRIDPRAMPSRLNDIPPRTPNNSWERGIPTDARNMPFLDANGQPMTAKERAVVGTKFDRELRAERAADQNARS